jgi:PAS domain S-box-containing protein
MRHTIDKLISNPESLKLVLDNLKEGVIAHDLNRRIFFFNREAERITGYDRSKVLGRDCHDIFNAPLCGGECAFSAEKPRLDPHREYRTRIITKSGTARMVEMSVTMMHDETGAPFGVLASFRDITDLFQLKPGSDHMTRFGDIIGNDINMINIFKQIEDLSDYDYPVHVYGETGTGKELIANAVHNNSHRAGQAFVPINCGALPEGLIESELFGHVKGAFTGAIRDKKGRFELADGGTVFLDEVAELSKHMQVKLLRFLQEGIIEKIGGESTQTVDVRIISATNRDLGEEVRKNNFREDLYYRLNVIPIRIPSLRDRRTDIPLLVDHFLKEAQLRHNQPSLRISKDALSLMLDYPWPGNIRQLQNAIQYSIVKCPGDLILPENLPFELRQFEGFECRSFTGPKLTPQNVASALNNSGGNKSKAAKLLGVGRATLYRFLEKQSDLAVN